MTKLRRAFVFLSPKWLPTYARDLTTDTLEEYCVRVISLPWCIIIDLGPRTCYSVSTTVLIGPLQPK